MWRHRDLEFPANAVKTSFGAKTQKPIFGHISAGILNRIWCWIFFGKCGHMRTFKIWMKPTECLWRRRWTRRKCASSGCISEVLHVFLWFHSDLDLRHGLLQFEPRKITTFYSKFLRKVDQSLAASHWLTVILGKELRCTTPFCFHPKLMCVVRTRRTCKQMSTQLQDNKWMMKLLL